MPSSYGTVPRHWGPSESVNGVFGTFMDTAGRVQLHRSRLSFSRTSRPNAAGSCPFAAPAGPSRALPAAPTQPAAEQVAAGVEALEADRPAMLRVVLLETIEDGDRRGVPDLGVSEVDDGGVGVLRVREAIDYVVCTTAPIPAWRTPIPQNLAQLRLGELWRGDDARYPEHPDASLGLLPGRVRGCSSPRRDGHPALRFGHDRHEWTISSSEGTIVVRFANSRSELIILQPTVVRVLADHYLEGSGRQLVSSHDGAEQAVLAGRTAVECDSGPDRRGRRQFPYSGERAPGFGDQYGADHVPPGAGDRAGVRRGCPPSRHTPGNRLHRREPRPPHLGHPDRRGCAHFGTRVAIRLPP